MTTADAITAVSAAIAAISFVCGVFAWKREFIGKRRIELAQSVLALFYEAEMVIQEIRNPFSFGEVKVRKPGGDDKEERIRLCDSENVVSDRYQKREKLFAELGSMKYQVMATFGKTYGRPFDEISKVLNEIFCAAQMLGEKYWPMQNLVSKEKELTNMSNEQYEKHQAEMHKCEAVIWSSSDDGDEIVLTVMQAIKKMESLVEDETSAQVSLKKRVRKWFPGSRKNHPN